MQHLLNNNANTGPRLEIHQNHEEFGTSEDLNQAGPELERRTSALHHRNTLEILIKLKVYLWGDVSHIYLFSLLDSVFYLDK